MTIGPVVSDHAAGGVPDGQYRPFLPTDGGVWRGPTVEAWVTRILQGAPAPRKSTGLGHDVGAAHAA